MSTGLVGFINSLRSSSYTFVHSASIVFSFLARDFDISAVITDSMEICRDLSANKYRPRLPKSHSLTTSIIISNIVAKLWEIRSKAKAVSIQGALLTSSTRPSRRPATCRGRTSRPTKTLVPILNSSDVFTTFTWTLGGSTVFVTGTFTNWVNHIPLQRDGHIFSTTVVRMANSYVGTRAWRAPVDRLLIQLQVHRRRRVAIQPRRSHEARLPGKHK